MDNSPPNTKKHPLNLNSSEFDSEAFVSNLLQRKGLDELVAVEEDMVQNVRRLDSEMQQLVYENYNKFLTATNTVRNMQTAFTQIDNEMSGLSERMLDISQLSESLSSTFNKNRETVRKLTEASKTVERLQYFVKLPQILKELIDKSNYKKAVEIYTTAKPKLEKYKEVKSMAGIYTDSTATMQKLQLHFTQCLRSQSASTEEVEEAVQLLRKLGTDNSQLQSELLSSWKSRLEAELEELKSEVMSNGVYADILEFVNNGGYNFLTNMSLHISLFVQFFQLPETKSDLVDMVTTFMASFKEILMQRFQAETSPRDCALFVSALDKISRKIAVFSRLLPDLDFSSLNSEIVVCAAKHQIGICRKSISEALTLSLNETIQSVSSQITAADISLPTNTLKKQFHALTNKLEQSFLVSVKTCLANLLLFTASDINFTNIHPGYFSKTFGVDVHENIISGSIQDLEILAENKDQLYYVVDGLIPEITTFFLVFASFVHNLQTKQLRYLMDLCQEQFKLTERKTKYISNFGQLCLTLKSAMEMVLRRYTEVECRALTQLVSQNIDSFQWQSCEQGPQAVRPFTKQLFMAIQKVNKQLSVITEDASPKKESTLDSFRGGARRAASAASNTYETASLNSSIMEKLWGEEPEESNLFSEETSNMENALANLTLELKKDSILTAIVRLTLKGMLEVVQKHKFSLWGLQQLQVDCGYLKHQLWEMVDEHTLNICIEEVVTAAVNLCDCAEPRMLDPSTVREICERSL